MTTPPPVDEAVIRFVADRLYEEEQTARAVADHRGRRGELRWSEVDPERHPGLIGDDCGNMVTLGGVGGSPNRWQAAHIALHDPAFALADVEYGRWLLADHAERRSVQSLKGLRRYAARWDNHPGFNPAWTVEAETYTEEAKP